MKRKILFMVKSICVMVFLLISTTVFADTGLQVTGIHGSANGWSSNANWIGFKLNKPLDLSKEGADVILSYEYVENGIVKQMRRESGAAAGTLYSKNKSWSGYLIANGTNYSSGAENAAYSDILPADTVIMSNLSNVSTAFPALTAKIQSGTVQYFRVRLIVNDEAGSVVNDSCTNWIKYDAVLTESIPKGIQFRDDYVDGFKALPELQSIPATSSNAIKIDEKAFPSIEDAIYNAKAGDTITIPAGVYAIYNQIVIDKAIKIVGAGKDNTVLKYNDIYNTPTLVDYSGRNTYPIIYATANLAMSNISIQGPTTKHHGIDGIYATANLELSKVAINDIRCTADGTDYCGVQYGRGIIAKGSDSIKLDDCEILRFQKQAIDVMDVKELVVSNSVITGAGEQSIISQNGIILRGKTVADIKNNIISNIEYTAENEWKAGSVAICLLDNSIATVDGNTIKSVDNVFDGTKESKLILGSNSIIESKLFSEDSEVTIAVTSISISSKAISLKVQETKTLTATVAPSIATNKTVIWSTSNSAIATVKDGVIKAVTPGKATITAKSADGSLTDVCVVTVTQVPKPIKVSKVAGFTAKVVKAKVNKKIKKSVKITWSRVANATGYQIICEKVSKNISVISTRTIVPTNKAKKLTYKTGTLGKGKYKYKIRAYTKVNGKKVYGPYTKYKTIKI